MSFLLDSHILLWWFQGGKLSRQQKVAVENASAMQPLLVADITLWEISMLYERGRISLELPLRDWLEQATAPPLVKRCPLTPVIAAEVADFPDSFHRDPADRIIVATARVHRATLLTQDRQIIDSRLVATLG